MCVLLLFWKSSFCCCCFGVQWSSRSVCCQSLPTHYGLTCRAANNTSSSWTSRNRTRPGRQPWSWTMASRFCGSEAKSRSWPTTDSASFIVVSWKTHESSKYYIYNIVATDKKATRYWQTCHDRSPYDPATGALTPLLWHRNKKRPKQASV